MIEETPIPFEQEDPEFGKLMEWYANLPKDQRKKMGGLETITNEAPKIGRNDLCSCGSGKKYKKCCMKDK